MSTEEKTCERHGWINCPECNNREKQKPVQIIESRYELLESVFNELLVEQFAISELRDLWRKKAGLEGKCIDSDHGV